MSRRLQQASSRSLLDSGVLNQSLLLLGQLGEAGNLAVLKGFAGVVHLVLDICQTASSNKVEAMALAEDVGHLAMTVAGQVEEHKDEISADTELLDQISKLCLELEAVHSTLKNLFKRGSRAWFVKHSKDEVKLQRLQRDIKHAIDLFSLQSSVRLQNDISRSEALDAVRRGTILQGAVGFRKSDIGSKSFFRPPPPHIGKEVPTPSGGPCPRVMCRLTATSPPPDGQPSRSSRQEYHYL